MKAAPPPNTFLVICHYFLEIIQFRYQTFLKLMSEINLIKIYNITSKRACKLAKLVIMILNSTI